MDVRAAASDLEVSLGEFKPEAHPSWELGEMFNALLAAAKEAYPQNPLLRAASPARQSHSGRVSVMDAGTMRAIVRQILSAGGNTGPAAAISSLG